MPDFKNDQANSAIIGIFTLLMTVFIVATLYFGQQLIIPLVLAILLVFFLSPIVTKLERWVGRIPAVLTIVIMIFMSISIIGYILSLEFIDLVSKLPNYKGNVETKLHSVPLLQNDFFSTLWQKTQRLVTSNDPNKIVEPTTIAQTAQTVIGMLIHSLVNIGFVMLLLIFMLLNREDLTIRIIKLIGNGHNKATAIALNDAGNRISHYLLMQLVINIAFGAILTVGLFFIGIPNALLWGVLLVVLRFIPYVGTWIAAAIPIILSFVISKSWETPILTISLYVCLDLVCANFIEPHVYGASTGVSSTALIIAAVIWTILWGPIGLLLAIPLTVCIMVIGRHVPQLAVLWLLLGDDDKSLDAKDANL